MAIHYIEGFDRYANNDSDILMSPYILSYNNSSCGLSEGRFSGNCLVLSARPAITFAVPSLQQFFVGAALKFESFDDQSSSNIINLGDHLHLYVKDSGQIEIKVGATVSATSALALSVSKWLYIAIDCYIHDLSGYFKLYVDGKEFINFSGGTKYLSSPTIGFISFGPGANYLPTKVYVDDLYLADNTGSINNTIILDCRVQRLLPTADTAQKDFTPLSGPDNYAMVDDTTPDRDTTYVSTSTDGHKDLYEMENLDGTAETIYAVSPFAVVQKTDADVVNLNCIVDSGGTESSPDGKAITSSYSICEKVIETDPATSAAWTPTSVNAIKSGFEVDYI